MLRFYGFPVDATLTLGAAGLEISRIESDADLFSRWEKYVYLTNDYDFDTDKLKPFNNAELMATTLPEDWKMSEGIKKSKEETASKLVDEQLYNDPPPAIEFDGKSFLLTGTFETKKSEWESAAKKQGGTIEKKFVKRLDYLVIATKGSANFKKEGWGTKIEAAVISRRDRGKPIIVSETHFKSELARGET
jgi:hypothetical protein